MWITPLSIPLSSTYPDVYVVIEPRAGFSKGHVFVGLSDVNSIPHDKLADAYLEALNIVDKYVSTTNPEYIIHLYTSTPDTQQKVIARLYETRYNFLSLEPKSKSNIMLAFTNVVYEPYDEGWE